MRLLDLVDVPFCLVLVVVLAGLLYVYGTRSQTTWKKLNIPGPATLPFLGNLPELYSKEFGFIRQLKRWEEKYGRIYGIYLNNVPTLVVSDPMALKQILVKDANSYPGRYLPKIMRPFVMKGIFFSSGSDWLRLRRIMTPSFSSGKLKLMVGQINRTASRLADFMAARAMEGSKVEAKQAFAAFSLDVVASTAFGLDINSLDDTDNQFMKRAQSLMTFRNSLKLWLALVGAFPWLGKLLRIFNIGFFLNEDIEFFRGLMHSVVKERKMRHDQFMNQMDFIQLLLKAEVENADETVGDQQLSTEEIASQCLIFVIAGYETSSSILQFLAYELARHPEVQSKLYGEIAEIIGDDVDPGYEKYQRAVYCEAVVNEALRMYPSLAAISRTSDPNEYVHLQGIRLPPKTAIMISLYGIGRDPEYFENPDTFDPNRFLNEGKPRSENLNFIPFGFGPRQCIGMRLALLQLKIALIHMVRKVNIVRATPDELELDDFTGIIMPREAIKLTVTRKSDDDL